MEIIDTEIRELSTTEIENVSGGILPLIALAFFSAGAGAGWTFGNAYFQRH